MTQSEFRYFTHPEGTFIYRCKSPSPTHESWIEYNAPSVDDIWRLTVSQDWGWLIPTTKLRILLLYPKVFLQNADKGDVT